MIALPDIQKAAESIAAQFPAEKIILFGSHAYGAPHRDSDVDLLVIMDFQGTAFRKSLEILRAIDPSFSCDLIVIKRQEFQRRYDQCNPLIGDAVDKGLILYERRSPVVA